MTIHEKLIAAGTKYRKELLVAPMVAFAAIMPYFNTMTGVQGKVTAGTLNNTAQLRPYRTAVDATDTTTITPREMENYKGDLVEEFDPSIVMGTLYSESSTTKADKLDISAKVAILIASRAGENLVKQIFKAERNGSGNTSATLFNGFDKLVALGVADESIKATKGNYKDISTESLNVLNVGDVLKREYRALDSNLKDGCKLYLPVSVMEMYEDWFQTEYGHTPWNEGVEQKFLVGSAKKCQFIPLSMMEGGSYLYFTQKENMCLLFDQKSGTETVEIRRPNNPKTVQMFMMAYFGVGIDTVDKEFFKALKYSITEVATLAITTVVATNETEADENDGTITITATGGIAPRMYSKDNGVSWQDSNVFEDLAAGSYTIKVRDHLHNVAAYSSNPVVITAGA